MATSPYSESDISSRPMYSVTKCEAEIITIATRPQARRRGMARQLLNRELSELVGQGVRHVFLEVAASNTAALGLYGGMGFREAGRRKDYYQRQHGREDAIVMRRELAP